MSALTEIEIFQRMRESLRIAAECAEALAIEDVRGREYTVLREHLKLIEGCCIQAANWREDTRWLPLGRLVAECHQKGRQLAAASGPRLAHDQGQAGAEAPQ